MIHIEAVEHNGERKYALYIDGKLICIGNMNAVNVCLYTHKGGEFKMPN